MRAAPIVILAATAAAAHAQVATWYWTVSDTGNGDGLIEPGESAVLTLWVGFDPRQDHAGGGVSASGPYDILGSAAWASGTITERTNHMWFGIDEDTGTLDDDNNILGIEHFQYPAFWGGLSFDDANPVDLVLLRWTPDSYTPQAVTLMNGAPDVYVYIDVYGSNLLYSGTGGGVTFHIVPAPASAAAFGLCAIAALRRRR